MLRRFGIIFASPFHLHISRFTGKTNRIEAPMTISEGDVELMGTDVGAEKQCNGNSLNEKSENALPSQSNGSAIPAAKNDELVSETALPFNSTQLGMHSVTTYQVSAEHIEGQTSVTNLDEEAETKVLVDPENQASDHHSTEDDNKSGVFECCIIGLASLLDIAVSYLSTYPGGQLEFKILCASLATISAALKLFLVCKSFGWKDKKMRAWVVSELLLLVLQILMSVSSLTLAICRFQDDWLQFKVQAVSVVVSIILVCLQIRKIIYSRKK